MGTDATRALISNTYAGSALANVRKPLRGVEMVELRVTYAPHPDATPEDEAAALACVYRFLLDRHAKKAAAHPGDPDDAERSSNGIRAKDIIPR